MSDITGTVSTPVQSITGSASSARSFSGTPSIGKGDKGDPGSTPYIGENGNWWIEGNDTGKPSAGATYTYTHTQIAAATTWDIEHNLNKFPSVTIVDSGGTKVYGEITYVSTNRIVLNFSAEFSGKAYLN